MEQEVNLPGLAKALAVTGEPMFKQQNGKSGLESMFEPWLDQLQFNTSVYLASPELLIAMARVTTPNHFALFALNDNTGFKAGFESYAKGIGLSPADAIRKAVNNAFSNYTTSGDLAVAVRAHESSGPYFEILPMLAGVKKA